MATGVANRVQVVESVTVTLTEEEALMLCALSGYVGGRRESDLSMKLYNALKVGADALGVTYYADAERLLGAAISGTPNIQF